MNVRALLTGKRKLLVSSAAVLLLFAVLLIFARSLLKGEPTPEEQRLAHLEYMVKLVEAYQKRHGTYPQPTARAETIEGIAHVWGYEPDRPALASCTIVFDGADAPDATASHCGGGVYDAKGKLIGWKGTLTAESGLNNIEAVHSGRDRIDTPLSEFAPILPTDPAYAAWPNLLSANFGEYVYAVRIPDSGALGKGGKEYQIAVTTRDDDNVVRTHIRGDYFVPSAGKDMLPASLIGPGILFDAFGNPVQSRPLHVLVDTQQHGYPNPVLGDGQETLQLLKLRRRAERLLSALDDRQAVLDHLMDSDAVVGYQEDLGSVRSMLDSLLSTFSNEDEGAGVPQNLPLLEKKVVDVALDLIEASEKFLEKKGEEVQNVLTLEVSDRTHAESILNDVLAVSQNAHETILLARDEILKYLDGSGIQEQSRNRAGRKLESVLTDIPDIASLFLEEGMILPHPFLSKKAYEAMEALAVQEAPREESSVSDISPASETGAMEDADSLLPLEEMEPAVMISTLTAELVVHFSELSDLLTQILDDLDNATIAIEEIDESLRKLARAMSDENDRIAGMFSELADVAISERLLSRYEGNKEDDLTGAMEDAAVLSKQKGDFSPLLFSSAVLDAVILEESPGIPDLELYESALEAEYSGVPYPLP